MGRFRASSLGSGAIILALLLLILHRNGTGLLFLVVGGALLWYGRTQREAQERAEREREAPGPRSDRDTDPDTDPDASPAPGAQGDEPRARDGEP